jgi:hypothetical protein
VSVRWWTGRGVELGIMELREDIIEGDIRIGHGISEVRV